MKQDLKILNKREVKEINNILKKQWGAESKKDYVFMLSRKNKLYIANKEVFDVDFENLKINNLGLYFGEYVAGHIRLSIDGSQIIGPDAKQNVLEISNDAAKEWMQGSDIKNKDMQGFVIIKSKNDFLGCGKATEDKILNYVPKARRINTA